MNEAERELTLEEMIAMDYSAEAIQKRLDAKLKERDKNRRTQAQEKARKTAISAIKGYLLLLGVPVDQISNSVMEEIFQSFEKEIEPALKIFGKMPTKKERVPLDDAALESALGALRAFADSL